jgi:hypothetical protein
VWENTKNISVVFGLTHGLRFDVLSLRLLYFLCSSKCVPVRKCEHSLISIGTNCCIPEICPGDGMQNKSERKVRRQPAYIDQLQPLLT